MKLRHPWLIRLVGFVGAWLIWLWMSTLRYRHAFLDGDEHPANPRCKRFIYALWHESILFPAVFRTTIHILISQHADGELIAQACRHLRVKTVRGSSTRGGTQALLQLLRISQQSHLLVTPDGPRGPRRKVQLGLIFLASQTGLPIVPCGVAYPQCWRARSWDRFAVPLPWTTALGVAGQAISVPPGLNRKKLEAYRDLVEQNMLAATAAAERWAATGKRPTAATVLPPLRASA